MIGHPDRPYYRRQYRNTFSRGAFVLWSWQLMFCALLGEAASNDRYHEKNAKKVCCAGRPE
jgi:hypothetical protein